MRSHNLLLLLALICGACAAATDIAVVVAVDAEVPRAGALLCNALRALSSDAASDAASDLSVAVVVAPYSARGPLSYAARDTLTAAVARALPTAYVVSAAASSHAAALNAALSRAECAAANVFALLSASVEVQPGFLAAAAASAASGGAAALQMLGCVLVAEDNATLHDAGVVDVSETRLIGAPPPVFAPDADAATAAAALLPPNVPVPVHVLRGQSVRHPRVFALQKQQPFMLGHECVVLPAQARARLGAFDEALSARLFMADYSLRARESGEVALGVCRECAGMHIGGDDAEDDEFEDGAPHEEVAAPFLARWMPLLRARLLARRVVHNVTVIWSMECGAGQTLGFTTEAVNFALALRDAVSLKLEVRNKAQCREELRRAGWPRGTIADIMRLATLDTEFRDNSVLVVHRDPGRYRSFITERWGEPTPAHVVGRSMFETDRIPSDWAENCNGGLVQRIWVPSAFNVETFARAGVNSSLLETLPEPIDTELFAPDTNPPPLDLPGRDKFVFLAVAKWEARKGIDKLVSAFIEEFGSEDRVSLFVRANVDEANTRAFEDLVAQAKQAKLESPRADEGVPAVDPQLLPQMVPVHKLPSLYAAADCFVLPTHGEGFGLPIIEAMAMGVPVIATNWSGCTAFLRDEDTFLLRTNGLVEVPTGREGHMWADPSSAHLRELMRAVYENQADAKSRAMRARARVVEHFSHAALRDQFFARLAELSELPRYVQPAYQPPTYTYTPPQYSWGVVQRPTRIKIN